MSNPITARNEAEVATANAGYFARFFAAALASDISAR